MPTSGEALLDTSVVIPYLKGDVAVGAQIQASSALYLPQTALGELYCGAYLSQNPAKHLAKIQTFLAAVAVLSSGVAAAEHYGRLRAQLAKAGTPIPENDIWIAAFAPGTSTPVGGSRGAFRPHHWVVRLKVVRCRGSSWLCRRWWWTRPAVVRADGGIVEKTLRHLGVWHDPPGEPPARAAPGVVDLRTL